MDGGLRCNEQILVDRSLERMDSYTLHLRTITDERQNEIILEDWTHEQARRSLCASLAVMGATLEGKERDAGVSSRGRKSIVMA